MTPPEGERFAAVGVFQEIKVPERLVYSWNWTIAEMEGGPDTVMTVLFEEKGGKTLFAIEHTGFPNAELAVKHEEGWNRCADNMIATI